MKKIVYLLFALLTTLSVNAQKEHLKFMGIPLTGSITNFQSKLTAKGISYDKAASLRSQAGIRCFTGMFSGEKAEIYVYYNEKTKIVYRAKAVVEYSTEDIAKSKYSKFSSMLREKYIAGEFFESEHDDYPAFGIKVPDSQLEKSIGFISLYISKPSYSFMDERYLHIDYEDRDNTVSDMDRNMDDL